MTPVTSLKRLPSPVGRLELSGDGEHVVALVIEQEGSLPRDAEPERPDAVLDAASRQLEEYFAGVRTVFELPLAPAGTPFQRAVWEELSRVPHGETTTYGALGSAVGRPTAGRAVGGAIGANPLPILVGCHRVLSSDGRITGYTGGDGVATKRMLLALEGVTAP